MFIDFVEFLDDLPFKYRRLINRFAIALLDAGHPQTEVDEPLVAGRDEDGLSRRQLDGYPASWVSRLCFISCSSCMFVFPSFMGIEPSRATYNSELLMKMLPGLLARERLGSPWSKCPLIRRRLK